MGEGNPTFQHKIKKVRKSRDKMEFPIIHGEGQEGKLPSSPISCTSNNGWSNLLTPSKLVAMPWFNCNLPTNGL